MARRVSVHLVDDIDPTLPATETIEFGWGGRTYAIDLSAGNADKMRAAIQPYLQAAKRVTARVRPLDASQIAAIRQWAIANGMPVAAKGRIPATVIDAYNARSSS